MSRNKALSVLRIFFTQVIIIHHSHILDGLLKRGYLSVEFFFMLSGYFLYFACCLKKYSLKSYIFRRLERLFPEYTMAYIFLLLWFMRVERMKFSFLPFLWDILMVQNIGFFKGLGLNYPAWYLSVLLYGSIMIFILLKKFPRKVFNIGSVCIIMSIYFLMSHMSPNIEQWDLIFGLVYIPYWRGIAAILLGILVAQIPTIKQEHILYAIDALCFFGIMYMLFTNNLSDYWSVPLFSGLIYANKLDRNLLNRCIKNKSFVNLEKYQYGCFLNHVLAIKIITFISRFIKIYWRLQVITIIFLTFILACITKGLVEIIVGNMKKRGRYEKV